MYLPVIQFAICGTLILAIIIATTLPPLISTWVVIILTVGGVAGLTFGEWDLGNGAKWILWVSLPLTVWLINLVENYLFSWQLLHADSATLIHFTKHYDAHSKLQTTSVASQIYSNEIKRIQSKPTFGLSMHLTLVHINAGDFAQLHRHEYHQLLKRVAAELKQLRLPSEKLFYLGASNLLIISFHLNPEVIEQLNAQTRQNLTRITNQYSLPLKQSTLTIDAKNCAAFFDFEHALTHLNRQLETKIVTEYLKGDAHHESHH